MCGDAREQRLEPAIPEGAQVAVDRRLLARGDPLVGLEDESANEPRHDHAPRVLRAEVLDELGARHAADVFGRDDDVGRDRHGRASRKASGSLSVGGPAAHVEPRRDGCQSDEEDRVGQEVSLLSFSNMNTCHRNLFEIFLYDGSMALCFRKLTWEKAKKCLIKIKKN